MYCSNIFLITFSLTLVNLSKNKKQLTAAGVQSQKSLHENQLEIQLEVELDLHLELELESCCNNGEKHLAWVSLPLVFMCVRLKIDLTKPIFSIFIFKFLKFWKILTIGLNTISSYETNKFPFSVLCLKMRTLFCVNYWSSYCRSLICHHLNIE